MARTYMVIRILILIIVIGLKRPLVTLNPFAFIKYIKMLEYYHCKKYYNLPKRISIKRKIVCAIVSNILATIRMPLDN